ncbi:MAG: FecR domain-containing protein [Myxococcota bacterium]|jgi:transmembrane sensor|nr:FecR domain-containing protein [Myxococcota bacterium]
MTESERLDRRALVAPPDDARRDDDNWVAIDARLATPSRPRWIAPAGLVTVAAAALLAFVAFGRDETPAWSGTTLVAGGTSAAVALEDGSEIVAAPGARLERTSTSSDEVRVALRDGSATFEVARNPARTFVVEADDVEVRVVGTRFVVRRELGGVVEVRVERGAVDLVVRGEVQRLRAGESRRVEPVAEASVDEPPNEAEETPQTKRATRARRVERGEPREEPREAFDAARTARRDGSARDAAELYERFLREFPRDERAGLAAFELGRLRMDSLSDPRGAAYAFTRALELAPRSPFAEDARARLVDAYARAGDDASCERSRARYLALHPEGRHVEAMRRACD